MGRALVVGAAGQVGQQIVRALGPENVIAAVRQRANTSAGPEEVVVDLERLALEPESASAVIAEDVSAVYCVGGATDVERCEGSPEWAMRTNCLGPVALAAAARGVPFAYFSTDYVFDGESGPYRESDPTHALSVYGKSKLRGEEMLLEEHPRVLILRTNVVYGPDPAAKNFLYSLRRNLSAGRPMRVMDDQMSTPTLNADLALAAIRLLQAGETGVFHVSGPEWMSRYEFAVRAAKILGLDGTLISPVSTAELQQKAPRPLRGGLLNERLTAVLPEMQLRGIQAGVTMWRESEAAG